MKTTRRPPSGSRARPVERETKKAQILTLHDAGITDVEELALFTSSRPSYVAAVLRDAGKMTDYFDLYTSSSHPMNVYSGRFSKQLGFKDVESARDSVARIDEVHQQYEREGDRAGQHHALLMALTMFNRARWVGKVREAAIFRDWLVDQLERLEQSPRAT